MMKTYTLRVEENYSEDPAGRKVLSSVDVVVQDWDTLEDIARVPFSAEMWKPLGFPR